MFPLEVNYKVLDSLPIPDKESIGRVLNVLKAILMGRVMPYFRNRRGTDSTSLARTHDRLHLQRLEDEEYRIRIVSVITAKDDSWIIHLHERIFDYLAFVIPSDPKARLGGKTREESKLLAFMELLLRHEMEHLLYPGKSEREVIRTDVVFAMDRRVNDPTYYQMLRNILGDEMSGLCGKDYLDLLEAAEQERPYEYLITRVLATLVAAMADIPESILEPVFALLDTDLKINTLGECYVQSQNKTLPLVRRVSYLQKVLGLFGRIMEHDEEEAQELFNAFRGRWDLIHLFRDLEIPDTGMEEKAPEEVFAFFRGQLGTLSRRLSEALPVPAPPPRLTVVSPEAELRPTKSLKERIEEARNDPAFPRQALEVIDKNKLSAVGHSGPKYTELIETLLAIPWGKAKRIEVSPQAFESGLDRSHYGLKWPKEIICDFFGNLIWRYQRQGRGVDAPPERSGSAFLFVGPPGVGKTSLAISIARNLDLPYQKMSLGGMRDATDLRGHGFTYEGSKPGAVVQGLIKMGVMNGMFIMDEADKTEKFAIATLLEILDPEQNHLFHDQYTMSTVDIDLSRCHFVLTANTVETVPPAVLNRCEVVYLDRYSIEEKVAIARHFSIQRVRQTYQVSKREIFFDPKMEEDLLRYLIKTYTHEAGVRELERLIRTLFLRILRKEILGKEGNGVKITREKIKQYLETPTRALKINDDDRVGEALALGVYVEQGIGSIIPIQATLIPITGESPWRQEVFLSMVHATGNIQSIMDESRKVATTGILHCAPALGIDLSQVHVPVHLHFMGSSTPKDGPSAGGAIALSLASAFSGRPVRRDVAMTGEIDTQGRILRVGGLDVKLETAFDAGCKTLIIPEENLHGEGGIGRLPEALKHELQILTYEDWKGEHGPFDYARHAFQVVAVGHIVEAAHIAFVDRSDLDALHKAFVPHALKAAEDFCARSGDRRTCFRIIYAKEPGELAFGDHPDIFWGSCIGLIAMRAETKEAVLNRMPDLENRVPLRVLSSSEERLESLIDEIEGSVTPEKRESSRVSIIAPYFFLKRDGIRAEKEHPRHPEREVRLFANNYTVQGVKIKSCKANLNRVAWHLANLDSVQLDQCPFLRKKEGVFVVDLVYIPEKYRLDIQRAEQILTESLGQWLRVYEGAVTKWAARVKTAD